jgi:hypothetical protein
MVKPRPAGHDHAGAARYQQLLLGGFAVHHAFEPSFVDVGDQLVSRLDQQIKKQQIATI